MKHIYLSLLAGLALASCSEISTEPAPARVTRTAQTVTVTYARTASTIVNDTVLVNPRLDVYVLTPTVNSDGTLTYPTLTGTTPVRTITDFSNPQPISIATNLTVAENTPNTGIRFVFSTTNRPGRRSNSQRLTASVVINGASKATFNHQGTNFSRNASATGGRYTSSSDTNVAAYTF